MMTHDPKLFCDPARRRIGLGFGLLVGAWLASAAAAANVPLKYNRDIQPILAENCFACHGADSASRKAGLRLDHFENATNKLESGAVAIVPGQPEQSELVRRIFLTDDDQMPPEKIHKTLAPSQKELLKKWIASGAHYEQHWSFIAPVKAPLPAVKNSKWVKRINARSSAA
jgi:mono/diheme cytochrome c family protein